MTAKSKPVFFKDRSTGKVVQLVKAKMEGYARVEYPSGYKYSFTLDSFKARFARL